MGLANKIPVPSDPRETGAAPLAFGLYVHVPFCAHACDFCAFYQIEPRRADLDAYLSTIAREMALVPARDGCDTAFWGGGTPGLLPARDLERLGRAQLERFGAPRREWTVELAPGSVRPDKLRVLRDLGVTRVSLGVQSFSANALEALGRRDSPEQIRRAWAAIQEAGFASTNLDLIFAWPGQTLAQWEDDLKQAIAAGPAHISTYCLTFEEDTALFVRLAEGKVHLDPERERAFYEATWDRLGEAGYEQYEISNHARPGHRCIHNVNTWCMQAWAGLGPSAASQGPDWRGANPADLAAWTQAVTEGRIAGEDRVALAPAALAEDALIFGLRMNDGVDWSELEARFGSDTLDRFRPAIDGFVAAGHARWNGSRLGLTREGRLVADALAAELVGLTSLGSESHL